MRVLIVVRDVRTLMRFRDHLLPFGGDFTLSHVTSLDDALVRLQETAHDVVLVDLDLPEAGGSDVLHRVRVVSEALPIVVLFDEMHRDATLQALRLGAQDCLSRHEPDSALVARLLQHAVERHGVLRSVLAKRAQAHHDATHDSLTQLPNRQPFLDGLERSIASARRRNGNVAVLFCDLDGFKAINDKLGHEVGDDVLAEIGRRLLRKTRRSDPIARLGGDEFALALSDARESRAVMRAAELLIDVIAEPIRVAERDLRVGVSIGVARWPDDADTAEGLVRAADLAMYDAKQRPGSHVCFFEQRMDREVHERFALVDDVREATRRREFFLEYQPQVDLREERVVGAEALVRWRHPERGRLAPGSFLSIAEDTGMMIEIGHWVLHAACEAATTWGDGPDAPRVAVNVSSHEIVQKGYPAVVAAALEASGLPPHRLAIEMTERSMVDGTGRVHRALEEIAGFGVVLAVDHFGAKPETLGILRWDALHSLKLDGSMLQGAGARGRAQRMLPALLAFGQALGLDTVAEGVESVEQLGWLLRFGCVRVQGFLLGEPVSAEELAAQLAGESKAPWREVLEHPELRGWGTDLTR